MNSGMNNSKKIYLSLFILIVLYALWNGRNWIMGPSLKIISPQPGEEVRVNPITVEGTARNVSFLSLNGRQIFVDKSGNWQEQVLLRPGENILEIFGKDRFNKQKSYRIYIYNNQEN